VTKGQQAMALAMIYPELKRGMHSEFRNGTGEVSKARLSYARFVLRVGPDDLAPAVLASSKTLDDALTEARQRCTQPPQLSPGSASSSSRAAAAGTAIAFVTAPAGVRSIVGAC
jgi:hypothetical protein